MYLLKKSLCNKNVAVCWHLYSFRSLIVIYIPRFGWHRGNIWCLHSALRAYRWYLSFKRIWMGYLRHLSTKLLSDETLCSATKAVPFLIARGEVCWRHLLHPINWKRLKEKLFEWKCPFRNRWKDIDRTWEEIYALRHESTIGQFLKLLNSYWQKVCLSESISHL